MKTKIKIELLEKKTTRDFSFLNSSLFYNLSSEAQISSPSKKSMVEMIDTSDKFSYSLEFTVGKGAGGGPF